jgi:hypothetical protein
MCEYSLIIRDSGFLNGHSGRTDSTRGKTILMSMVPEAKKSVGALKVSPGELIMLLFHPLKWATVKRKLEGRRFRTENELFSAISREWDAIDQGVVDGLLSSCSAGLQTCINHD